MAIIYVAFVSQFVAFKFLIAFVSSLAPIVAGVYQLVPALLIIAVV